MAIRPARRVRPLVTLAALGAASLIAPALAAAVPQAPHAEPTVTSVQKQLGELALKNTQLVEKYNHAQVSVHRRLRAAEAAKLRAKKANAAYRSQHVQFAQIITAQYESDNFGAAGALLDSSSGTNYLDRLATLDMVSNHTAQIVASMSHARSKAIDSAKRAKSLLAKARSERDGLADKRTAVEKQIRKYQDLLATLTAAQQATWTRTYSPAVSTRTLSTTHLTKATSAQARRAVQFALNQVGKPYVWGAAGPGAYDCSGLTMSAWHFAGVNLPHSAADQYNYGTHVSRDNLQPGDLIFFYQPIGHVTIYIGNGLMVSAPTEGQPVAVVPLNSFNSDYTGATRLT